MHRALWQHWFRPALVFLSTPPVIPGLGTSGGFELQVEARNGATFENLVDAVDTLVKYAANDKALSGVSSSLQAEIPQLYFDVDRDRAFPPKVQNRMILNQHNILILKQNNIKPIAGFLEKDATITAPVKITITILP